MNPRKSLPRHRSRAGRSSCLEHLPAGDRWLLAAALLGCLLPSVGCKTGTSFSKPSWWTFGSSPKDEAASLAAAPPYGGDIKKPSESAKPYPTTSTPSGYVITGTGSPAETAQFQAPQQQAPVVYGTTPPAMTQPAASVASAAMPVAPAQPASPGIAPQVGPYAALGGDTIPPPGQPLPPIAPSTAMPTMAAMPGMASMPAAPTETPLPGAPYSRFAGPAAGLAAGSAAGSAAIDAGPPRMADSRLADPAAAVPAAAIPAEMAAAYGGSRYSSSTTSRFSGAETASFAPSQPMTPPSAATPVDAPFQTPTAAPFGSPAVSPAASPAVPPSAPGLLQPSSQPVRRPDPGYRPGGTSSYRPSRTILADDQGPSSTAVRTAAYEEPSAASITQ